MQDETEADMESATFRWRSSACCLAVSWVACSHVCPLAPHSSVVRDDIFADPRISEDGPNSEESLASAWAHVWIDGWRAIVSQCVRVHGTSEWIGKSQQLDALQKGRWADKVGVGVVGDARLPW